MSINIVWRKDQLVKETNNGAIRERKIIGFPLEKTPINAFSNLFYWSHSVSEFGCLLNEKPIIGFETFTYVIRGNYEVYNNDLERWITLTEGEVMIIKAGKGTRIQEKLLPKSETVKIWFDPGFEHFRRMNPSQTPYIGKIFPVITSETRNTEIINSIHTPGQLHSKDVSIKIENLKPGKHILRNSTDYVLSIYILEGYLDIIDQTLSIYDFFSIQDYNDTPITAISDCKLLVVSSPLKPEFQTYAEMHS
jgi:redox-sensitive bicupin YhaK (pirin superfamily)